MQTFKQYLTEEREIYGKKRSEDDIKNIPSLSSSNLETVSKVGKVIFDQEHGLGQTPYNKNVVYRGFVGMMLPSSFSDFTPTADRDGDATQIMNLIEQGYGIGSPFLILDIGDEDKPSMRIVGHEGRARCIALTKLQPNVLIPVHFILYGEGRARHITKDMVAKLNTSITAENSKQIVKNKIRSIWLNGTHVSL